MMNSQGLVVKEMNEEHTRTSDEGSACAGPETDRFGFIRVNGPTAGSEGPAPEQVRHREAKWINLLTRWDHVAQRTSKVKEQCQKGIPASLRAKCWPLLCGACLMMKEHQGLYQTLDLQPALQNWVDVIERDLDRQFPFHEMFVSKDGHGQRGLFRVLKAYTQYQPEDGYCQAQGPVAAVLLMNMPAEEAFWCLVQISEHYLPGYYSPLLEGVIFDAAILTWVLKRVCPAAHKHLQLHGVEPLMYATDWLMCLFTRHLPFNTLLRVWDLFFCYGVRVLFQVAVVLVRRALGRAEQRKACQGQMETLEKLRSIRELVQQEEDEAFIAEVCSVPLTGKDLQRQTEKELEKWKQDRPSSTFDPRGRCLGYRMVWARVKEIEDVRDRKGRELGNLSIPLVRSSSTLSLSPSILRKKWGKSSKAKTGEWVGSGKVGRQLSMGPWEGGRDRWRPDSTKRVQCLEEEDKDAESYRRLEEPIVPQQTKLTEAQEQTKGPGKEKEQVEERKPLKEHQEKIQTVAHQEPEEEKPPTENARETQGSASCSSQQSDLCELHEKAGESDLTQRLSEVQLIENDGKHIDCGSQRKAPAYREEQEQDRKPHSQSQAQEKHNHNKKQALQEEECLETGTKDIEERCDGEEDKLAESESAALKEEIETKKEDMLVTNATINTEAVTGETEKSLKETHITLEQKEMDNSQPMIKMVHSEINTDGKNQIKTEDYSSAETDNKAEAKIVKNSDPVKVKKNKQESETKTQTDQESVQELQANTEGLRDMDRKMFTKENRDSESYTVMDNYHTPEGMDDALEENTIQKDHETLTASDKDTDLESNMLSLEGAKKEAEGYLVVQCVTESENTDLVVHNVTGFQTNSEIHGSCTKANLKLKSDTYKEPSESSKDKSEVVLSTPPEASEIMVLHTEKRVGEHNSNSNQTETSEKVVETPTKLNNCQKTNNSKRSLERQESFTETENQNCSPRSPKKMNPLHELPSRQSVAEKPKVFNTVGSVEDDNKLEKVEGADTEQGDNVLSFSQVVTSCNVPKAVPKCQSCIIDSATHAQNTHLQSEHDPHLPADSAALGDSGIIHAAVPRGSSFSGDFRVRKSRLSRRLSEDLFTAPQQTIQSPPTPSHPDIQTIHIQKSLTSSLTDPPHKHSTHTQLDTTCSAAQMPIKEETQLEVFEQGSKGAEETMAHGMTKPERTQPDNPKRFRLFHRQKREQRKPNTGGKEPKIQVPTILIQDFSDEVGQVLRVEDEGPEKLSSRERRKMQRERKRREKAEELRKKKEKELEKERGRDRRTRQIKGMGPQVQEASDSGHTSQNKVSKEHGAKTNLVSYDDSYF